MALRTLIIVLLAVAALSGCGRRGNLEVPGESTPAPSLYGAPLDVSPLDPGSVPAPPGQQELRPPARRRFFLAFLLWDFLAHAFEHKGGAFHAGEVPAPKIAGEVGTPFFCYSRASLSRHYRVFAEAFAGLDH